MQRGPPCCNASGRICPSRVPRFSPSSATSWFILPPAKAHDASAIAAVTTWVFNIREPLCVELGRSTPPELVAKGVSAATPPAEQRRIVEKTELSVVEGGVRGRRLPVRTEQQSQRRLVEDLKGGESEELLWALASMKMRRVAAWCDYLPPSTPP